MTERTVAPVANDMGNWYMDGPAEHQVSVEWCVTHDCSQGDFSVFGHKDVCPVFLFGPDNEPERCDIRDGVVWKVKDERS